MFGDGMNPLPYFFGSFSHILFPPGLLFPFSFPPLFIFSNTIAQSGSGRLAANAHLYRLTD